MHKSRMLAIAAGVGLLLGGCRITISADRPGNGADRLEQRGRGGEPGRPGRGGAGGASGQAGEPGRPGQPGGNGVSVLGSGRVETESRPVAGFDSVSLAGSAELYLVQNGTESASVEAEDNLLPYLISEVRGRQLVLGVKPNITIQPTIPIIFRVSAKELNAIEGSGSGMIDAREVSTEALTIDQSGSLETTLQGRAPRLDVTLSGSGRLDAGQLESSQVSVDISGSGKVLVGASSRLGVRISGSGSVEYLGNPEITRTITGSGSVTRR